MSCFSFGPKKKVLKNYLLSDEQEKPNMLMVKMAWTKLRLKMGILGKNSEILTNGSLLPKLF